MSFRTRVRWGQLGLALASFILCVSSATAAGNQADVQLQTDLSHMVIRVDQAAPMPPGGCTAGHTWHTTFGGCRRQETHTETTSCPAGMTGSRVRYRTAYVLQANASDIAYGDWGPWQDSCTAPPPSNFVITVTRRPSGIHCERLFEVRVNYPDGGVASGIPTTWRVKSSGTLESASAATDGKGLSRAYVGKFGAISMTVTVTAGSSSIDVMGVCVGGGG